MASLSPLPHQLKPPSIQQMQPILIIRNRTTELSVQIRAVGCRAGDVSQQQQHAAAHELAVRSGGGTDCGTHFFNHLHRPYPSQLTTDPGHRVRVSRSLYKGG